MRERGNQVSPHAIRQQIFSALTASEAHRRAILFEPSDDDRGDFRAAACTIGLELPGDAVAFPRRGFLLRWLRVNNRYLPIPDEHGVFRSLPSEDQDQLRTLSIAGCAPLVYDHRLVAWLGLVHDSGSRSGDAAPFLLRETPLWARALFQARAAWRDGIRVESVARANRLTAAGQMAASVAHEIRNPLAAVRSALQSIVDHDAPQQEHPRLIRTALDEIDGIASTLTHLLALGRVQLGHRETCDLRVVADEALRFCRPYAQHNGIRLDAIGPAVRVEGNFPQLRQVLINLTLNACQAMNTGGTIRLETGLETLPSGASEAIVRVVDSGSGIPADVLVHVFEPFYTTKADGGGLGLPICREIIERHSGKIDLTSSIGVGTVVTIRLGAL